MKKHFRLITKLTEEHNNNKNKKKELSHAFITLPETLNTHSVP